MQFMSWSQGVYSLDVLYPLQRAPFLGLNLSVPRRAKEFLLSEYGPTVFTMCKTHYWNHREENSIGDTVWARCARLLPLYGFRTFRDLRFLNGSEVNEGRVTDVYDKSRKR